MCINAAGNVNVHHFGAKLAVFEHHIGRNLAGLQDVLIVVDVVQERVQRRDALCETFGDFLPLFAGNHMRHDVKRDQALGTGGFAIHSEGDADAVKHQIGGLAVLRDFLWRRVFQPIGKSGVLRTHAAIRSIHLVVKRF